MRVWERAREKKGIGEWENRRKERGRHVCWLKGGRVPSFKPKTRPGQGDERSDTTVLKVLGGAVQHPINKSAQNSNRLMEL